MLHVAVASAPNAQPVCRYWLLDIAVLCSLPPYGWMLMNQQHSVQVFNTGPCSTHGQPIAAANKRKKT
jgi:hypothetical protein